MPFLSLAAAGQATNSSWENVKAIAAGTEVRVAAGASNPIRGKLESVTDSSLTVTYATGTQSFQRPEIRSVSVKKKSHRLRNTFIGLGVGAAAGLGIGGAAASGCTGLLCDLAIPAYGAIGFIAGTVTGLVWPTGGWRPVYAP
jgi:hypothetical protein